MYIQLTVTQVSYANKTVDVRAVSEIVEVCELIPPGFYTTGRVRHGGNVVFMALFILVSDTGNRSL